MKKEKLKKLRDDVKRDMDSGKTFPGYEFADNWMAEFEENLRKVLSEAANKYPKGDDALMEALTFGLAHFTCTYLEKLEQLGTKGKYNSSLYDVYMGVIMPTAHDVVKEEFKEKEDTAKKPDFAKSYFTDLTNKDMPIEAIIDKYFKKDLTPKERQGLYHFLSEAREDAIKHIRVEYC